MILIGQYDSPYVRRVGIALTVYGFAYEHRPWSTFGDANKIAPFNPLMRVPTLILDNGAVVLESAYALDWLDEEVRARGDDALIAASGADRQKTLYYIALATGFSDKAISLFYEQVLHKQASDLWLKRCHDQMDAVLDVLEAIRAAARTRWLLGDTMTHADIALACSLRHAREAHPDIDFSLWAALSFHSAQCEEMEVFKLISQPFIGPSADH
ncbi:glutathione S-transferase family protein [Asticcacaulis sp. 201]|uniref:glutathione S-transferase family protein n=1 Tax=Asticcacaulis sp. 201 TaxID=3028787 RepID=UPI002916E99E|nr:glutathione S-transferase N-terminal domain-containing protein [Asticcacaulis sp. 201]MDV6333222.1 glutathione S-transferase N-terminal domain-containing protein [Asticcacaulis sp. 201]